jgi:aminoglycoside phosphotransferase family enzyme
MADDGLGAALLDPVAYPHVVQRAEVIETHIARVFPAGERA